MKGRKKDGKEGWRKAKDEEYHCPRIGFRCLSYEVVLFRDNQVEYTNTNISTVTRKQEKSKDVKKRDLGVMCRTNIRKG